MRTTQPLSDEDVLRFLCDEQRTRRQMPTIREVAQHFGHSSPTSVQRSFARLLEQGDIERDGHRYQLAPQRMPPRGLPLVGRIAAGRPMEAIEADDFIDLGEAYDPLLHFGLVVQGDSMIEAHIVSGDIAVIRRQETCRDGDIVAAVIDGEATLKQFFRRKSHIELKPANRKMKLITAREVEIRGVLVGLLRKF